MSDETATIERDLAAVEAALASDAATHVDPVARELQELALRLQADAPRPREEFAERLRARMQEGFPGQPRAARRAAKAGKAPAALSAAVRNVLLPLGGVAAASLAIVALVLVAGSGGGGHDDSAMSGGRAMEQAQEPAVGQRSGSADDAGIAPAQPLPRDGGFAPGQRDRRIERTFSLELDVRLEDVTRVADQVTAVTNRHGGFVLSSSVNSGRADGGGDFSLRIPTERLRPALRDLAQLAPVIRQSQEGRDVTREHVTAKDRLQAARAERRSLLRRLELADTDAEAEALRRQLDLVAGEINGLRAQLKDLRLRTDYAVVAVSLLVAGDHDEGGNGVSGSFDDALDDAGALLVGFAGVLIRALALAIPVGVIALAALLAARAARRRRRESALA